MSPSKALVLQRLRCALMLATSKAPLRGRSGALRRVDSIYGPGIDRGAGPWPVVVGGVLRAVSVALSFKT